MKGYVVGAQDFQTYFDVQESKTTFTAKHAKTSKEVESTPETSNNKDLEISSWDADSDSDHPESTDKIAKICETEGDRKSRKLKSREFGTRSGQYRNSSRESGSSDSEFGYRRSLPENRKRSKLLC